MMQHSKTPFFVIIGLALVAVAGMAVAAIFLPGVLSEVTPIQPPANIEVVAAPALQAWANEAAQKFNQANQSAQVKVIAATDLIPAAQFQAGAQAAPPAAWLAEASFVVEMAARDGYRFTEPEPVASTHLTWGAYNDKLAQFNDAYGDLNWENLAAKARSRDGFRLIIAAPQNSAEGLAALASATAAQLGQETLSAQEVGSLDAWLTETLGNNNAQLRPKPAETLASVQGRSIGEAGLLTLASWRQAKLDQSAVFSLLPVEPTVRLDYPLTIWNGPQATPEGQQAARAFQQFLLEPEQQNSLARYGFDPASAEQAGVTLDGEAAQRLLNWASRVLR